MAALLRPVDLQTMLPNSIELQRVQQSQNSRPASDQQAFSRELLQHTQVQQEQVQQSDSSAEQNLVNDGDPENRKRRFRYLREGKRAADPVEEPSNEATDDRRGHRIDIKI